MSRIKLAKEIIEEIKERGPISIPKGYVTGEAFEKWLYGNDCDGKMKTYCINVILPLLRHENVSLLDIESEINYRHMYKMSSNNGTLKQYSDKELSWAYKLWEEY